VNRTKRPASFYLLTIFFLMFLGFLYGPTITIGILSFQGESGGLTFPMNGVSLHWYFKLFQQQAVGDFGGSFSRSILLGLTVMSLTIVIALSAGLAFRKKFTGATILFYTTIASLIIPSILVSLGIGLLFNQAGIEPVWYGSGLGAHLTWTLPFGLLIMFAVFNRFDKSYEAAARDMRASNFQVLRFVVVPLILPSLIGVALFGFTLSYDEFARTLMAAGSLNTLPLEIYAMTTTETTPVLYALGSLTTFFSLLVIIVAIVTILFFKKKGIRRSGGAS
jgi:putative spermidine/putrescine transport system permease protein